MPACRKPSVPRPPQPAPSWWTERGKGWGGGSCGSERGVFRPRSHAWGARCRGRWGRARPSRRVNVPWSLGFFACEVGPRHKICKAQQHLGGPCHGEDGDGVTSGELASKTALATGGLRAESRAAGRRASGSHASRPAQSRPWERWPCAWEAGGARFPHSPLSASLQRTRASVFLSVLRQNSSEAGAINRRV